MRETQATIAAWRDATFGPKGSTFRMACRANEEMAELLRAVSADAPRKEVAKEIADVLICLCGVADAIGAEMPEPQACREDNALSKKFNATKANYRISVLVGDSVSPLSETFMHPVLIEACEALYTLAASYGIDAAAAVDEKMAINRSRVWKLDGTGHGYHVREEKRKKTPAPPAPAPEPSTIRDRILSALRDGVCRSLDVYRRVGAPDREVRDALSELINDGTVTAGTDWVLGLSEGK